MGQSSSRSTASSGSLFSLSDDGALLGDDDDFGDGLVAAWEAGNRSRNNNNSKRKRGLSSEMSSFSPASGGERDDLFPDTEWSAMGNSVNGSLLDGDGDSLRALTAGLRPLFF
jgi:hypothetical protein